jgi:hypothetical protein
MRADIRWQLLANTNRLSEKLGMLHNGRMAYHRNLTQPARASDCDQSAMAGFAGAKKVRIFVSS